MSEEFASMASRRSALHLSVSEPPLNLNPSLNGNNPDLGPSDRRAKWVQHNMNRSFRKRDRQSKKWRNPGGQGSVRFRDSLYGRNRTGDSGYHENGNTGFHNDYRDLEDSGGLSSTYETTVETPLEAPFDSPFEGHEKSFRSYPRWASSEDTKSRLGSSSLPFELEQEQDAFHHHKHIRSPSFSRKSFETRGDHQHSLIRKNGVRYSLNLRRKLSSHSGSSISSESEASQEGCENTLNPSSALLLPNGEIHGRKHSVLFSSYDAWNEENVVQGFRELSPGIGSVLEAAWTGENATLEELLADPETLEKFKRSDLKDPDGRTPLHLAAACGHTETVQLLIDKGASVNEFDNQNATPLACAASCGSLPVLEILLSHGADVNAGYDFGKTALHWAVQVGSVDCAKKLLELGALQNPIAIFSETPLHEAAMLGDEECLQLLLDYGADTTLCKGPNRSTALHLAAEEGNANCISVLLKAGASHEAKDLRGHTALHIAATCDADCVLALLKGGANPNAADCNGRTPLHCAVSRGSRAAECVRMLVDKGAEIDAQDLFGYTPLHLAAVNESSQCASILLSRGADVTAKTKAGTTALNLLVRKIPDVFRYLVDRLDAAVTIHDHDPADPDCEIRLDFRGIVPNVERRSGSGSSKEHSYYLRPRKETEFLTCILAAGHKKILAHPLSEAFLTLKWQRVRKFFWASLLFQIALVALFTIFVVEVYVVECPYLRHHDREEVGTPAPTSAPTNRAGIYANNIGGRSIPTITMLQTSTDPGGTTAPIISPIITGIPGANNSQPRKKRSSYDKWFGFTPRVPRNKTKSTRGRGQSSKRPESGTTEDIRKGGRGTRIFADPGASENTPPDPGNDTSDVKIEPTNMCKIDTHIQVIWALLVFFAILMAIKEIFQLLQSPFSYVVSSENWGQWALIGSVSMTAYIKPEFELAYWQYPAAAVGIFLAWGLMLLQVGRFPALGLYVQMLGKVAANFGLFILAYACLLIAFALAFCVLFPEYPPYTTVPMALLKVLTMMVGEVDYEDLFYNPDNKDDPILYPITAHVLHGAFVITVTIVLMNLLVGLAVHDIQGLQKGAKLNRLSRQTALISRLESFIFSKRLQSCLPRSIGSVLLKSALLVPSSYNWSFYFRPNDPRDQRLPKDLKIAALRLAASKHSSRTVRGNADGRLHLSNSYSNGCKSSYKGPAPSSPFDPQGQAAIRRIEQRLDRLQLNMDLLLKGFNDKLESSSTVLVVGESKEKIAGTCLSVNP